MGIILGHSTGGKDVRYIGGIFKVGAAKLQEGCLLGQLEVFGCGTPHLVASTVWSEDPYVPSAQPT